MRASLVGAAGLTVAASLYSWVYGVQAPLPVVEPTVRHNKPAIPESIATTVGTSSRWLIDRDSWSEASADPFVPKQPPPPPPVVVLAPPPPRPVAPPFPYKYFGRTTAPDGKQFVYLTQGDRLIPVSANETLEGAYRIESIADSQIVVLYVPLNEKTVITVPSAQGSP